MVAAQELAQVCVSDVPFGVGALVVTGLGWPGLRTGYEAFYE